MTTLPSFRGLWLNLRPPTSHNHPRLASALAETGASTLGPCFDPAFSTQLRHLVLDEDTTVQPFPEEAISLLFQAPRTPPISQIYNS